MPDLFAISSLLLLRKVPVGKTVVVLSVVDQVIGLSVPLTHSFESVYRQERGKESLLTQQR